MCNIVVINRGEKDIETPRQLAFSGRSLNRHYEKVKRKKKHPASKCRQPKCLVCSGQKVYKVQNRQTMQINDDTIQQLQELNIKRKQKWTKMRQ